MMVTLDDGKSGFDRTEMIACYIIEGACVEIDFAFIIPEAHLDSCSDEGIGKSILDREDVPSLVVESKIFLQEGNGAPSPFNWNIAIVGNGGKPVGGSFCWWLTLTIFTQT